MNSRQLLTYLFTASVGILITVGGCVQARLYAKVDDLEKTVNTSNIAEAVTKKDIENFQKATAESFEYIKRLIERDYNEHHKRADPGHSR
jgi:hypothetical protein